MYDIRLRRGEEAVSSRVKCKSTSFPCFVLSAACSYKLSLGGVSSVKTLAEVCHVAAVTTGGAVEQRFVFVCILLFLQKNNSQNRYNVNIGSYIHLNVCIN